MLLDSNKTRTMFSALTTSTVLILGRIGEDGSEVSQAVDKRLRMMGYIAVVFDFGRSANRSYMETIQSIASLSRIIVADIRDPYLYRNFYEMILDYRIPVGLVLEKGNQLNPMFTDILSNDRVVKPIIQFKNFKSLIGLIKSKVVEPAEKLIGKRHKLLDELSGEKR